MLLGQKVMTPDRKQGFISCIYADELIDVDILAHDAKHPSDTTTFGYYKKDVVVCVDQIPRLGDITPLGRVRLLEILTDGIIRVGFHYKYGETFTLWLSDARVERCPAGYTLPYANWVDKKDYDYILEHFDLEYAADGAVLPKRLAHPDIPHACAVEVTDADKNEKVWQTDVDGAGNIDYIKTCDGKKLTSLEELRDTGIVAAEVVSRYPITGF